MDVTVFYAWQDDRPRKLNRYLIRDAAKAACERITNDSTNEFAVSLDEATRDTPGMCDIPNTILEKIRECDIILADLTLVGETDPPNPGSDDEIQKISNPNVLFEFGYAVGGKVSPESDGFDRVLGMMNTAYGEPKQQMFDIKRRWVLQYNLPEESERPHIKEVEKSLSKDIEGALRLILDKAIPRQAESNGLQRFERIRSEFEAAIKARSFRDLWLAENVVAFTLVPDKAQQIEHARLREQQFLPPTHCGMRAESRGRSRIAFYETNNPNGKDAGNIRCAVAELDIEGTILAADTFFLCPAFHHNSGEYFIPSTRLERLLIESVAMYATNLNDLGISLPWRLGISLLGIKGFRLYTGPWEAGHAFDDENLVTDPVTIHTHEDAVTGAAAGRLLKDTFDFIWREFGFDGSPNYDKDGNWKPRR